MRIEDREEYIDLVAQAVIDRIEERDRIEGMVGLVVARVLALQQEHLRAKAALAEALIEGSSTEGLPEEESHAEH
jgi:hypothetical protein